MGSSLPLQVARSSASCCSNLGSCCASEKEKSLNGQKDSIQPSGHANRSGYTRRGWESSQGNGIAIHMQQAARVSGTGECTSCMSFRQTNCAHGARSLARGPTWNLLAHGRGLPPGAKRPCSAPADACCPADGKPGDPSSKMPLPQCREHRSGFHLDLFSVLPCEHAP